MKKLNILNSIGNTPLINIDGIFVKIETTNPSGSIKDRMVSYIIEMAEKRKELKKGSLIIEVTSGNTGISASMISSIKGYRFIAVMPDSMSIERRKMIEIFGGKIILTPGKDDMIGAVKKYESLVKKNKNAWLLKQFQNPDNVIGIKKSLGKEIIKQTNGKIDAFVAGVGTGGTLIGVAKALREEGIKAKIIAVEPAESAVLSGEKPKLHKIQGIGEGFIPKIIEENKSLINEVIKIKSSDAIKEKDNLAKKFGTLVGISSGANFLASKIIKNKYNYKNVITVFPDRGERYLSKIIT